MANKKFINLAKITEETKTDKGADKSHKTIRDSKLFRDKFINCDNDGKSDLILIKDNNL